MNSSFIIPEIDIDGYIDKMVYKQTVLAAERLNYKNKLHHSHPPKTT